MPQQPKSDHLKLVHGTFRKDRAKPSIAGDSDPPDCPDWLPDDAKAHWLQTMAHLNDLGVALRTADADALAAYCQLFSQYKADPAKFPASRFGLLAKIWQQFGFTPRDRALLGIEPRSAQPANPFNEL